jgi:hypothetical protein
MTSVSIKYVPRVLLDVLYAKDQCFRPGASIQRLCEIGLYVLRCYEGNHKGVGESLASVHSTVDFPTR